MKLINAILLAILAFILNEFVYFSHNLSLFVNTLIFLSFIFLQKKYGILNSVLYVVLFTGTLLFPRPREIHLISLDYRGDFEYYSFLSQKIFFLSFHSFLMLLFGIFLLFNLKKIRLHIILKLIIILSIIATIIGFINGNFIVQFFRADLRWFLFLFIGYIYCANSFTTSKFNDVLITLVYSLLFLTLANVIYDLLTDFRFKFSSSFIYLVPIYAFLNRISDKRKNKNIFLFFNIPVTSTDFILYFTLLIDRLKKAIIPFIIALPLFLFSISSLINDGNVDQRSFLGFILREASLIDNNFGIDKSTLVRLDEINVILNRPIYLNIFGTGLGSYFELNNIGYELDRADFDDEQLSIGKFNQPHTFLAYIVLKFGFTGLFLLLFFSLRSMSGNLYVRLIYVISFLSSFYWVPFLAFFWGLYFGINNNKRYV